MCSCLLHRQQSRIQTRKENTYKKHIKYEQDRQHIYFFIAIRIHNNYNYNFKYNSNIMLQFERQMYSIGNTY